MFTSRAQGYFTWAVLDSKNRIVRYAPRYEKNLITNSGLNGIAVRTWADSFLVCAVGTGNSAPAATQTALDSEVLRTGDYLNESGANSSSIAGSTFVLRRTFVFPTTLPSGTYKEAGFSHSLLGDLFSRVVLPDIPVVLGQRLIIQYDLAITLSPATPTSAVNPVSALSSTGSSQYQLIGLKGVNSSGASYFYDAAAGCNEPSIAASAFLSTDSTAPAVLGSAVDRTLSAFTTTLTNESYVTDSFTQTKSVVIGVNEGKGNWRSLGLGGSVSPAVNTGFVHVFNSIFAKTRGNLSLSFLFSWAPTSQGVGTLHYWQNEDNLFLFRSNPLLQYFGLSDE